MSDTVPAIYENGVLRLLQPLPLREQEVVSLVIERLPMSRVESGDAQQEKMALDRMLEETAALPPASPVDGFSNRDHDRLLYGDDV